MPIGPKTVSFPRELSVLTPPSALETFKAAALAAGRATTDADFLREAVQQLAALVGSQRCSILLIEDRRLRTGAAIGLSDLIVDRAAECVVAVGAIDPRRRLPPAERVEQNVLGLRIRRELVLTEYALHHRLVLTDRVARSHLD